MIVLKGILLTVLILSSISLIGLILLQRSKSKEHYFGTSMVNLFESR